VRRAATPVRRAATPVRRAATPPLRTVALSSLETVVAGLGDRGAWVRASQVGVEARAAGLRWTYLREACENAGLETSAPDAKGQWYVRLPLGAALCGAVDNMAKRGTWVEASTLARSFPRAVWGYRNFRTACVDAGLEIADLGKGHWLVRRA
jgi:hypothetical protein